MTKVTYGRYSRKPCCAYILRYMPSILGCERLLTLPQLRSIATLFGHVPWLGVYLGKIPAATGNLVVLLNACAERTIARLKRGSEKKDLFHYLVRPTVLFGCFLRLHRA